LIIYRHKELYANFNKAPVIYLPVSLIGSCLFTIKNVKKILEVITLEQQVWNKGDIEGYVNCYAPGDSTPMILSKGAAYGKEGILAFYKK
jgi:hypothetical protein